MTASSIVVACVGRFSPQFNEFRVFKVHSSFRLVLRLLMFQTVLRLQSF